MFVSAFVFTDILLNQVRTNITEKGIDKKGLFISNRLECHELESWNYSSTLLILYFNKNKSVKLNSAFIKNIEEVVTYLNSNYPSLEK